MEELKKKFIVETKLEDKKVSEYLKHIIHFCKVSKDGAIIIEKKDMTIEHQIKLSLVARYLANYLEPNIPAEVSNSELGTFLNTEKAQVGARLAELRKAKQAIPVGRGVHKINPLEIEKVIEEIEERYGVNRN